MRIIAGKFKGKPIMFLKSLNTRPLKDSVKESVFNIVSHSKLVDVVIDNSKNPLKPKQMKAKEIKEKGSIIVFPSYEFHKVAPIIKGTRYSLVIWFLGKPFKWE